MDEDSDHSEDIPAKMKPPDENTDLPHTNSILVSQSAPHVSHTPVSPNVNDSDFVLPPPLPSSSALSSSSTDVSSQSITSKSPLVKRHRCYPEACKGPYEVFVRQKDKPVKVLLVSAEVHKHFRSVKEVKQIGFSKVRIIFSDRSDANNVVYNELLSRLYRVYIPSERVEIDGVIYQSEMDLNYLAKEGHGKFVDPRVPQVSILECQQLAEESISLNPTCAIAKKTTTTSTMCYGTAIITRNLESQCRTHLIPYRQTTQDSNKRYFGNDGHSSYADN
ncbi:uncharacterized protein LOC134219218 [Armigeres subalbatus]|uniref:uncharacterized protein LOC134219218 n=1 Tax=Armigeres subalbatus TaxID=124917 RepID=UPI002ED3A8D4